MEISAGCRCDAVDYLPSRSTTCGCYTRRGNGPVGYLVLLDEELLLLALLRHDVRDMFSMRYLYDVACS